MQQMPDSPYYRLYTPQPPFPAQPEKLPLTPPVVPPDVTEPLRLYGKGLTAEQLRRERPRGVTRWLMAALVTLLSILAVSAVGITTVYVGSVEGSFVGFLMLVALGLALTGRQRNGVHERQEARWREQLYLSATADGLTTVWYPDRVEQVSPRHREVVTFSPRTRYVEHVDFVTLEDGEHTVSLRAADLTPEQAQAVYERICAAVPPERQYADGRFLAERTAPLPPPFPASEPTQYDCFSYTPAPKKTGRGLPNGLLWWLMAADLVFAGMLTSLFAITTYFVLDFLIFLVALFAAMTGISLLWLWLGDVAAAKRNTEDPAVTLIFTGEGLLIERAGVRRFVPAADVHARRTENGATLFTPAGKFTFSWQVTHNRQQLEWMLFGTRL